MAIARATAAVARAAARPPQLALARAAAVPKPQQFHTSAAPQGGHHLMFEPSSFNPFSWPLLAFAITFGGGNMAVVMMFKRSMRRFGGGAA
mmetsp:Transcript_19279/g.73861  ORF Transcript_19279/g.73861 Transcript_19279/m.73861 type:complete len:91 (-) Transcript_19279:1066-1338(-)